MSSAQPTHDPALAHVPPAPSNNQQPAAPAQPAQNATQPSVPGSLIPGMANEQVMNLLKHIPELFSRGDLKDSAAAEALSNLSQSAFMQQQLPQPHPGQFPPHGIHPHQQPPQHNGISNEPGPSSHPRGPPNLGQLSAVASALQANAPQPAAAAEARPQSATQEGSAHQESPSPAELTSGEGDRSSPTQKTGRRGGRSATMTNDEWARIRKDNHKEVERRRRGNINEGINELGRIVPNGSGEKAKGAILSRAVQYIHHLKENEARNIEKWTLEKLLMDQAMGDLQAQLEEMRRMWEEERVARQRAEAELELLRGHGSGAAAAGASAGTATTNHSAPAAAAAASAPQSAAPGAKENGKREREEGEAASGQAPEGDAATAPSEGDDRAKRPRVE